MRNDKIIPGVVLILLGAAFLLHNYHVIHFHWGNFFHLWPIFIVIAGINLIFANNRSTWATALKLGVVIIGFCLIIFGNFGRHTSWMPNYSYYDNDDDNDSDDDNGKASITKNSGSSEFTAPFTAQAKVVTLNINGGGAVYTLNDTTNQLFAATTRQFKTSYLLNSHNDNDSVYVLNFNMHGHKGINFDFDDDDDKGKDKDSSKTNSAVLRLNPNPEWNINVKTGATELHFDLSKFKIRSFNLNGGAADFNVKLGQPLSTTNVSVNAGVSDVTISVPASAACHIKTSTGLSSTSFDGFSKVSDGTYETPGFNSAKNKMYITINGGLADFKVKRY